MTDPSFRKITFNAHDATCRWFEQRYGYGWSERVRDLMDRHMTDTDRSEAPGTGAYAVKEMDKILRGHIDKSTKRTLEDLAEMYPEGKTNE